MKKRIILCLFSLLLLLSLTGCGTKEDDSDKDNNRTHEKEKSSKKEKEQEEKKENNQSNSIVDDDEIIDIDDEENKPPMENEKITVEKIINCEGCVYAYFSEEGDKAKKLGDTVSENEYTTDINNLKTRGGKQRHNFFGLVLSGNTISKAYSCILKDNKIYCIEGSTDGTYHTNNIGILNQIFNADQCKTLSDGHNYWCTDGSYNGNSKTSGYTELHYETSCTIYGSNSNTGKLICH
jgi:predicted small lipoprotein YifL